jgi:hypothetical protein
MRQHKHDLFSKMSTILLHQFFANLPPQILSYKSSIINKRILGYGRLTSYRSVGWYLFFLILYRLMDPSPSILPFAWYAYVEQLMPWAQYLRQHALLFYTTMIQYGEPILRPLAIALSREQDARSMLQFLNCVFVAFFTFLAFYLSARAFYSLGRTIITAAIILLQILALAILFCAFIWLAGHVSA